MLTGKPYCRMKQADTKAIPFNEGKPVNVPHEDTPKNSFTYNSLLDFVRDNQPLKSISPIKQIDQPESGDFRFPAIYNSSSTFNQNAQKRVPALLSSYSKPNNRLAHIKKLYGLSDSELSHLPLRNVSVGMYDEYVKENGNILPSGTEGDYRASYKPITGELKDKIYIVDSFQSPRQDKQNVLNTLNHEYGHLGSNRYLTILDNLFHAPLGSTQYSFPTYATYTADEQPSTAVANYYKGNPVESAYYETMFPKPSDDEISELNIPQNARSDMEYNPFDMGPLMVEYYKDSGKNKVRGFDKEQLKHSDNIRMFRQYPAGYYVDNQGNFLRSPVIPGRINNENPVLARHIQSIGGGTAQGYKDLESEPGRYFGSLFALQKELEPLYAFSKPSMYRQMEDANEDSFRRQTPIPVATLPWMEYKYNKGGTHISQTPTVQRILQGLLSDNPEERVPYVKYIPYLRPDIRAAFNGPGKWDLRIPQLRKKFTGLLDATPYHITPEMVELQESMGITPGMDQITDVRSQNQIDVMINKLLYGKKRREFNELWGGGVGIGDVRAPGINFS